ncbi:MAG: phytoene desaturase family protein [Chlorobi bacterium]|nr:phytoene desaturase family protein [Chlorobiota bacterium]
MSKHVVIVGAGLGGLSAAIHLRAMGFDVDVYEKNTQVGGRANRIERDEFRFDTGPSLINYPWVFEQLFAAAGAALRDYVELLPLDPSVEFYWRDGSRLQLGSDFERLAHQFEQFEPTAHAKLAAFLATNAERFRFLFDHLVLSNARTIAAWIGPAPKRPLLRLGLHRSLDAELARFFRSDRIRAALGSYAMYLGGSPYSLPGTFSILPFGELYYGLWYPRGGIYALVEAIRRRAEEIGVRIFCKRPVRSIVVTNGRAQAVQLDDGTTVTADAIVSNVDVPTTQQMVQGTRPVRRRWTMTPGVITFYWGISRVVECLHHHCIFLPDDPRTAYRQLRSRLPEDLPFYVCMPSRTDSSAAPTGCSTMFVLVPSPTLSGAGNSFDWQRATDRARNEVLQRLRLHGVELSPSDIAVEHVWTPLEWQAEFGLYDGSAFGLSHTLWNIGPLRPPNRDPRIAGLYYVGASTTPGTGLPMVVLGGKMVAQEVAADARRRVR